MKNETNWKKTADELPEDGRWVLIHTKSKINLTGKFQTQYGKKVIRTSSCCSLKADEAVYWMDFPKLPSE